MYSFGVSGWYGVGMSNWSVYKRMSMLLGHERKHEHKEVQHKLLLVPLLRLVLEL